MSNIEVKCPGCQRRLRLNEQLRGKAVRCPDCRTAFSLKPADDPQQPEGTPQGRTSRSKTPTQTSGPGSPRSSASKPPVSESTWRPRKKMLTDNDDNGGCADTWNDDPYSNSYGSGSDDPYSDVLTATLPGRMGQPSKRRPAAIPWTKFVSIVLVILGFASFGLAVLFLAGPIMNSLESLRVHSLADDMELLPVNTAGVIHVQVEDLLKYENDYAFLKSNPLTKMYSGSTGSDAEEFIRSIRSFTMAIPDDTGKQRSGFAGSRFTSAMDSPFMVLRLNKAISESEFEQTRGFGTKTDSLEGKSIFRNGSSVLCRYDASTLLAGLESDLVNTLKGTRNATLASECRMPSVSGQFCFSTKTSQFTRLAPLIPEPPPNAPEAIRNLAGLVKSIVSIKLVSGVIGLDAGGMNIHLDMQLERPEGAVTLKDQIQLLLKSGLDGLPAGGGMPAAISAISSLQTVVKPTQVTTDSNHVVTDAHLSKAQLNEFAGQMPL